MALLRQLGRSLYARLVARVLIAALILSLVPLSAEASIPQAPPPDWRLIEDIAFAPAGETACLVVLVVADPIWLTKDAFGELLAHTGSDPQPYAFAGEPLDPTVGFQYHRARWMDPRVGLFLGMDPWEGTASDPRTLHRYLYAAANPADITDPSGRFFSIGGMVAIVAVAAIIVGIAVLAWRPRSQRREVVNISYANAFTLQLPDRKSEPLTGSEADSIKVGVKNVFAKAFSGFGIALTEGGARHRVLVNDECCTGDAGETRGNSSWVNYGGAASWARSHGGASTSRPEMVAAIAQGLGNIVAHEVAHQFVSYTHEEKDEESYDYRYTYRSPSWFYGPPLHWTPATRALLSQKLPGMP